MPWLMWVILGLVTLDVLFVVGLIIVVAWLRRHDSMAQSDDNRGELIGMALILIVAALCIDGGILGLAWLAGWLR